MVVHAAEAGTGAGRAALEELCRIYWRPLYGFARRTGLSAHDAEDLTQGFFEYLLFHNTISRADASRGRFRTFLLTSFRNFHSHQRAHDRSQKRGGGHILISLDALREAEAACVEEAVSTESPERIYDRRWAASMLAEALASVRREYTAIGKAELFEQLKGVLWGGRGEIGYAEIASRLGSTEGAIKVAVHRLRRRFREKLRAEVAMTVDDPAKIDDELHHLLAAIGT